MESLDVTVVENEFKEKLKGAKTKGGGGCKDR